PILLPEPGIDHHKERLGLRHKLHRTSSLGPTDAAIAAVGEHLTDHLTKRWVVVDDGDEWPITPSCVPIRGHMLPVLSPHCSASLAPPPPSSPPRSSSVRIWCAALSS